MDIIDTDLATSQNELAADIGIHTGYHGDRTLDLVRAPEHDGFGAKTEVQVVASDSYHCSE